MQSYTWSFKLLHWLMAILFVLMFFAFLGFEFAKTDTDRVEMLVGHSTIGSVITVLLIIRLVNRFIIRQPQSVARYNGWHARVAKLGHYFLYLLMIIVPLSGYLTANFHELPVMAFARIPLNGTENEELFAALRLLHSTSVKIFMFLIAGHIGAAIFHKLILKDNVMYSMRPWFQRRQ